MGELLLSFVPEQVRGAPMELCGDLQPVVARLGRILPPQKIWEFFSSTPIETGGRIVFPYCRLDSALTISRTWIYELRSDENTAEKFAEIYQEASLQAFRALTWVEIGFEGLPNLAVSPASRNWTSAGDHFVNDEQRATRIMTDGKKLYEDCLRDFTSFRDQHRQHIADDHFIQYKAEYLLVPFAG